MVDCAVWNGEDAGSSPVSPTKIFVERSSKWLGNQTFNLAIRVQIPYALPGYRGQVT